MESSMDLVAKYCTAQLASYMDCVGQYPNNWQEKCEASKMELASCAQKNPMILKIKQACSGHFKPYEACLQQNPTNLESCVPFLHKFAACAEKVAPLGL